MPPKKESGGSTNQYDESNDDLSGLEDRVLGPTYNYSAQIIPPGQLGMSAKGTFGALANDIGGLIAYVQLLVTGRTNASKTRVPLGTKFFLETPVKCKDAATNESVKRYLYFNNVPDGTIPFISDAMSGSGFSTFKGLVPGVMSNLNNIHPMQILQAFTGGANPPCRKITMETIDSDNVRGTDSRYVSEVDIDMMNPCWFPDKRNPVDGNKCNEAFTTLKEAKEPILDDLKVDYSKMPDDLLIKLYYSSLGLLGLYILLNFFLKKKSIKK